MVSIRSMLGVSGAKSAPPPSTGGGLQVFTYDFTARGARQLAARIGQGQPEGTSVVASVLGWIGRTFPEAPIAVKERVASRQFELLPEHAMCELIESPNKYYSGAILWAATIIEWWVDGNAYWLKRRNERTLAVEELWWVPSWMMEPKGAENPKDGDDFITHYEYRPNGSGAPTVVLPEDVVHFRNGLDPANTRKGIGKFRPVLREIFTDEEAARFTASILANMGVPGLIISPSKESEDYEITPEENEATKEYIQSHTTGTERGKPLAFSGPIQVHQFGFSPEQMNLRELRRIPEERISGIVGIAAIVAGLGAGLDRSTFANYAEAREASYEENIIPSQRILAADVRNQLLPDFEDDKRNFRVIFDTSEVRILQEDKNAESTRYIAQYAGGIATLGEVRGKLGYEVGPEHDVLAVPLSVVHMQPSDIWRAATARVVSPDGEGGDEPPGPGMASRKGRMVAEKRSTRDARFLNIIERRSAGVRARLESDIEKEYDAIGRAAATRFTELLTAKGVSPDGVKAGVEDVMRAYGFTSIDELMSAILTGGIEGSINAAGNGFTVAFRGSYISIGEIVFEEFGDLISAQRINVDMSWNLDDPAARRVVQVAERRVNGVNIRANITRELRKAIAQGMAEDEGARDVARRIRSQVGSTSSAATVARTEVKYAQNVSSLEAYRKSDIVTGLRAYDNQTGYNDEDCTARDGEVYSFEDADRLTAEEHPNGTLSWAPVIGDN